MATILLSILVALLAFAGMAVGLMFKREPIKGSCGGMGAMMGGEGCAVCGGDAGKCAEVTERGGRGEVRHHEP